MIQIFLKPSMINEQNWSIAYEKICSILHGFPTKIIRIESYNGFSPELDKKHFDLFVDKNTENEHVSFWGDWMSYTGRITVRFYKNWNKQLEHQSCKKEIDENKSITWFPHESYSNDGSLPEANGIIPFNYPYIDTEGAHYVCALIAIGTMLENLIHGGAFITIWNETEQTVNAVVDWLEDHFEESFELPLFFDKKRLLASFINEYENKKDAACQMAHLFRNKHKQNMEFAIENIGYESTFEFYTEVLANTSFGTFGFSDVLTPWIAVTKNLESTLNLVLASKDFLLKNSDNKYLDNPDKYDLKYILKQLLNEYVLWSPEQREQLEHFYTNKSAIETGEEDLFGTMRRMMGYRVNISPIYCSKEELFESFMYKEPKNGKAFKEIIDGWITENEGKYEDLKEKLEQTLKSEFEKQNEDTETDNAEKVHNESLISNFVSGFKDSEKYFVEAAVSLNPNFLNLENAINKIKKETVEVATGEKHKDYAQRVRKLPRDRNVAYIRSRIKEVGYAVNPEFEKWLEEENNEDTLFYLHFLTALKLYDRGSHFARFQLLWNKDHWRDWG